MAYSNAIPAAGDRLKISQGDLINNFAAIQALLEVNHTLGTFDSPVAGDTGKHSQVMMPENAAPTATGADEGSIYCNVGTISGQTELIFKRENNTLTTAITEYRDATVGGNDGYVYLGGGNILMRWNEPVPVPIAGSYNVTFTGVPGPAFAATPFVFVTPIFVVGATRSITAHISDLTVNGFKVYVREINNGGEVRSTSNVFNWLAIGRIA